MAETNHENLNIQGILLALRYLSREAEGAGLKELAKTLEEAELKCDKKPEPHKDHCRSAMDLPSPDYA
jgi:hypothetical protein